MLESIFSFLFCFTDLTDFWYCSTSLPSATPNPFMVFGVWQPEPITSLEYSVFFVFPAPWKQGICSHPYLASSVSLFQRFFWIFRVSWWSVLPNLYLVHISKGTGMASRTREVYYHPQSQGRSGWAFQGTDFKPSPARRTTHSFLRPPV